MKLSDLDLKRATAKNLSNFENPRPAFHVERIGSILTGCSRCLRMILFMICEEAVYTLANLE